MEKVIAQLEALVTMSPHDSFSDTNTESRATSTEASTSTSAEEVLEVCRDQSQRIRQLSQENLQLRDTVRQLKVALSYSHELHNTANSDRKAACDALMELERQLEMALREKKALEEGLQKASRLLEEHRNKSLLDNRRLEQTQAMYDELKDKYDVFQNQCDCHLPTCAVSNSGRNKENSINRLSPKRFSLKKNLSGNTINGDVQLEYEKKISEKNIEINEMVQLSQQQTQIILKQGQEISNLQERIEQLTNNNSLPLKEENVVRTFFRRSFSTRKKRIRAQNESNNNIAKKNL